MLVLRNKCICSAINAVLWSFRKLAKSLKELGLIMNPCDPCAWSKIGGDNQVTIAFHTDNLMLCHTDSSITIKYAKLLDNMHGSRDPLTMVSEKIHEYLGITIYFALKVGCLITQYDFAKKIRKDLGKGLKGPHRNNLAADFLLKVDPEAEVLTQKRKEEYRETAAKCI